MKEVRIIAPSMSLDRNREIEIKKAKSYFEKLGYNLTTGIYIYDKIKYYGCSSIKKRVKDLINAFLDKNVSIIVCADGGYNVNQILPYLDYEIIKNNPKMIVGFSDITALLNAIYAKTGMTTYLGPMLTSFSSNDEFTLKSFEKILRYNSFKLKSSKYVYDFEKINGLRKNIVINNTGLKVLQEGNASGTIIGGNLCTLNLLQGTEYMPKLDNCILFIEDDADDFVEDVFMLEFDRNLESLLMCSNTIKGIVFGRFQRCSNVTFNKLKACIKNKEKLKNIPIVCGADFGHTKPMITIPIGGYCKMNIKNDEIIIKIEKRNNYENTKC